MQSLDAISFWKNLNHLQRVLLLSNDEFLKNVGIDSSDFEKLYLRKELLPLEIVFKLSEKFNFYAFDLFNEDFVYEDKKQFELLEKYRKAQYSKIRPILNILDFLRIKRGDRAVVNLMRKFQLREEFLKNPDNQANIFLITDVVSYLKDTFAFSDYEFYQMGLRTPFVDYSGAIVSEISKAPTMKEAYTYFVEELSKKFDLNFKYSISKLSDSEMIIDSTPNLDVLRELNVSNSQFGSEAVCLTRMGVISSISMINHKNPAKVEKIQSIYNGGSFNRYRVEFLNTQKLSCFLYPFLSVSKH